MAKNAKKRKWLVKYLPDDQLFLPFQDFEVTHYYLQTYTKNMQSRLRKRGQKGYLGIFTYMVRWLWLNFCLFIGHWNYTHTIRKPKVQDQVVEIKIQLSHRSFSSLLLLKDEKHYPIYITRRCFIHKNQYFQLDIYRKPCHKRYTTNNFKTISELKLDIIIYCFVINIFVWF